MRTSLGPPPRQQLPIKPWALFVDDVFVKSVTLEEAQQNFEGPFPTENARLIAYARRLAYNMSIQKKSAVMFTNTVYFMVFLPDGRRTSIGPGKQGKIVEAYNKNVIVKT